MKHLFILLSLVAFKAQAQKPCNLSKYVLPTHVSLDSNANFVYYHLDGEKEFIAIQKNEADDQVRTLFKKQLLNYNSLTSLSNNVVMAGAPMQKFDSTGKISYYSALSDTYTDEMEQGYFIKSVVVKNTSDKTFTLLVKLASGQFDVNYELNYSSPQALKLYKNFADKFNSATLTCISTGGMDY